MKKTIKMNIRKAIEFLDEMRSGVIKQKATEKIMESLTEHLTRDVYVNGLRIWRVTDADKMRELIKNKGRPAVAHYGKNYLLWKEVNGQRAHEVSGKMKRNTFIEIHAGNVLFYIPSTATTRTSTGWEANIYNFGPIHERRKSVLKATVVFAWQDIMKNIFKTYKEFAEK